MPNVMRICILRSYSHSLVWSCPYRQTQSDYLRGRVEYKSEFFVSLSRSSNQNETARNDNQSTRSNQKRYDLHSLLPFETQSAMVYGLTVQRQPKCVLSKLEQIKVECYFIKTHDHQNLHHRSQY